MSNELWARGRSSAKEGPLDPPSFYSWGWRKDGRIMRKISRYAGRRSGSVARFGGPGYVAVFEEVTWEQVVWDKMQITIFEDCPEELAAAFYEKGVVSFDLRPLEPGARPEE